MAASSAPGSASGQNTEGDEPALKRKRISPGLCHGSFPCLTEHWTELESVNEPPCKRKCLSLRRKENKLTAGDGERRVGATSG